MNAKTFHARICLSEAADALNCDGYAPEYKAKRIKQERADYVEAFDNPDDAEAGVLSQFDEMLKQLPETK